ncbi:hypothetical protein CQA53_08215 [Helicobacter didelphidarum]|uniref:Divergent polysaccharide deacetylase family protein n=1 Tax=Helicobacter didelphidarum TaxID=2040648 RepID=A0A3D8IED9_9HELI|nr:divergent polysaccharide deacetylase family protein [Helicobacter didelphidarum]RDU63593.1 hypothetical protein CQA53_08215 [Helicobacter didelphidarum]
MQHNPNENRLQISYTFVVIALLVLVMIGASIAIFHYIQKSHIDNHSPLNIADLEKQIDMDIIELDSYKKTNNFLLPQHTDIIESPLETENRDIFKKNSENFIPPTLTKDKKRITRKPKVAIIIDDLAKPSDIRSFQNLGLRLNLSLFPKHTFSKDNPNIAKTLEFYMIHLPLEAQDFEQKGVRVLRVGDSEEKVQNYIDSIKHDFPNLKYLNNHTGSRYTASIEDMKKLFDALDKHSITFVDSKTSANSVAKQLAVQRHQVYLARNIFLDNEKDRDYISKQLEKALQYANKHGYVIAIGHPKKQTLEVLKKYSHILKTYYDLVYISEMDDYLRMQQK